MAGTEFTRPALLGAVRGNYDRRIAELAQEINDLHALTVEERHTAWRASAEARLSDLFRRVNEATDAELTGFRIEGPPRPDDFRYRIRALDDQIDALQRAKEKALSYVSALAATDSGIVTLNAADLRRIGYGL
jgi:hypothetical protein